MVIHNILPHTLHLSVHGNISGNQIWWMGPNHYCKKLMDMTVHVQLYMYTYSSPKQIDAINLLTVCNQWTEQDYYPHSKALEFPLLLSFLHHEYYMQILYILWFFMHEKVIKGEEEPGNEASGLFSTDYWIHNGVQAHCYVNH